MGVPPEMQERIFDEFVQADVGIGRRFGGTGLGLAISRRLAALMGGELSCESRLGAGSTFRLTLPVTAAAPTAGLPWLAAAKLLTVLVVDDDQVNREVGVAMLRDLGHEALAAASGAEALAVLRRAPCDAMLMDIHMPSMDGIELAAAVRALDLDHPPRIIGVTADLTLIANNDPASSEPSRRQGCRPRVGIGPGTGIAVMLPKPLMRDALRQALQQAFDRSVHQAAPGVSTSPDVEEEKALAPMQAGPLDEGFLAQQMELLGRKRLAFLAQLFARSSDEIQDELECAAAGDERDAVRRAAHRLAGSAGALGLSELVTHASFIETQSARMSREALAGAVARIASLRRRAIAHLDTRLVERANEP